MTAKQVSADTVSPVLLPDVVAGAWKSLDLEGLRSKLDEQGLGIAERQDAARKSRAALAERTKEFRRGGAPEAVKAVAALLKAYQEEVDRLTARAKQGESAFLDLYRLLYAAPDPAPALVSGLEAASRAAELEAQVAKLSTELAEYKAESKELKNQDLTIRKLQEQVAELAAELEERDRLLEEQQEAVSAAAQERAAEEMADKEARLADELGQARAALETLQRLHQATQSQLFSIQSRSEEEAAGMQSELEFATAEVERAQARLATLEREKEALLAKVQAAAEAAAAAPVAGGAGPTGPGPGAGAEESLRAELHAQRDLASRLQVEVSTLRQNLESEATAWSVRHEGLKATLEAREAHCAALEAELAARPSQRELDELRAQVRILQAVGYNVVEEEEVQGAALPDARAEGGQPPLAAAPADPSSANGSSGSGGGGAAAPRSLEAALLAKAKRLEHRLTMARLELEEARAEAEAATGRAAGLEAELREARALVARLEEDLLTAGAAGGAGAGAGTGAAGAVPAGGEGLQPAASLGSDAGAAAAAAASSASDQAALLAVLTGQRDRLRARVRELEERAAALGDELARVRSEAAALRSDNLALVERLKFVQGYSTGGGGGGGVQRRGAADLEAGAVLSRYSEEYEALVNPFADFKAREREARRRSLPLQDKAMLKLTSVISSNKAARTAVFAYALLLHGIVFLVLARSSHHHISRLEAAEEECMRQHRLAFVSHHASDGSGGGGGGNGTQQQQLVAAGLQAAGAVGRALLRLL